MFSSDHLITWDLVLPMIEFAYNNSINKSIGLSPFEVVTGCKPRKVIDHPVPIGDRPVHPQNLLLSMCVIFIPKFDDI